MDFYVTSLDYCNQLQLDIFSVKGRFAANFMNYFVSKIEAISFSRNKKIFLNTNIANLIPRTDCVKDLTLFIDLKLYFLHSIVYIIFHFNRTLNLLPTVLLFFFKSL
jgi:hypothetical protein